jgi:hypothetical protein
MKETCAEYRYDRDVTSDETFLQTETRTIDLQRVA